MRELNEEFLNAVKAGDEKNVQRLLREGAEVDVRDGNSATPLQLATKAGNTGVMRALIQGGADVNLSIGLQEKKDFVIDWDAPILEVETPLVLAVKGGNNAAVKLLLESGANPEESVIDGKSLEEISLMDVALRKGDRETHNLLSDAISDLERKRERAIEDSIRRRIEGEFKGRDRAVNEKAEALMDFRKYLQTELKAKIRPATWRLLIFKRDYHRERSGVVNVMVEEMERALRNSPKVKAEDLRDENVRKKLVTDIIQAVEDRRSEARAAFKGGEKGEGKGKSVAASLFRDTAKKVAREVVEHRFERSEETRKLSSVAKAEERSEILKSEDARKAYELGVNPVQLKEVKDIKKLKDLISADARKAYSVGIKFEAVKKLRDNTQGKRYEKFLKRKIRQRQILNGIKLPVELLRKLRKLGSAITAKIGKDKTKVGKDKTKGVRGGSKRPMSRG